MNGSRNTPVQAQVHALAAFNAPSRHLVSMWNGLTAQQHSTSKHLTCICSPNILLRCTRLSVQSTCSCVAARTWPARLMILQYQAWRIMFPNGSSSKVGLSALPFSHSTCKVGSSQHHPCPAYPARRCGPSPREPRAGSLAWSA